MLQIRKGWTYRNRNCIDLDMHVVAIKYLGLDYFKLEVAWVNRHHPHILIPDNVKLFRKDLKNWTILSPRRPSAHS